MEAKSLNYTQCVALVIFDTCTKFCFAIGY